MDPGSTYIHVLPGMRSFLVLDPGSKVHPCTARDEVILTSIAAAAAAGGGELAGHGLLARIGVLAHRGLEAVGIELHVPAREAAAFPRGDRLRRAAAERAEQQHREDSPSQ